MPYLTRVYLAKLRGLSKLIAALLIGRLGSLHSTLRARPLAPLDLPDLLPNLRGAVLKCHLASSVLPR